MKNSRNSIILIVSVILMISCNKEQSQPNIGELKELAAKYNFTVTTQPQNTIQNKISSFAELEKTMSLINSQKNSYKLIRTDSNISSDTSSINKNILNLMKKSGKSDSQIKKLDIDDISAFPVIDDPSVSGGDPTYKYSQTLYFVNSGFSPNYAVQIQYNAQNGIFTGVNINVSPYGTFYAAGQFAYLNSPMIYYSNGSLAFQINTGMTYTLNVPGIPYLGFSTTTYNQFNGYFQLNNLNNLYGSGYEKISSGPELTNTQ